MPRKGLRVINAHLLGLGRVKQGLGKISNIPGPGKPIGGLSVLGTGVLNVHVVAYYEDNGGNIRGNIYQLEIMAPMAEPFAEWRMGDGKEYLRTNEIALFQANGYRYVWDKHVAATFQDKAYVPGKNPDRDLQATYDRNAEVLREHEKKILSAERFAIKERPEVVYRAIVGRQIIPPSELHEEIDSVLRSARLEISHKLAWKLANEELRNAADAVTRAHDRIETFTALGWNAELQDHGLWRALNRGRFGLPSGPALAIPYKEGGNAAFAKSGFLNGEEAAQVAALYEIQMELASRQRPEQTLLDKKQEIAKSVNAMLSNPSRQERLTFADHSRNLAGPGRFLDSIANVVYPLNGKLDQPYLDKLRQAAHVFARSLDPKSQSQGLDKDLATKALDVIQAELRSADRALWIIELYEYAKSELNDPTFLRRVEVSDSECLALQARIESKQSISEDEHVLLVTGHAPDSSEGVG